jgi:hypothetical protein
VLFVIFAQFNSIVAAILHEYLDEFRFKVVSLDAENRMDAHPYRRPDVPKRVARTDKDQHFSSFHINRDGRWLEGGYIYKAVYRSLGTLFSVFVNVAEFDVGEELLS